MTAKISQTLAVALALIICLAAYYFGLFIDLTGDAGKYAAIARHIVESNDWINLEIHDEAYDQKPPLLFWLSALGFKLGGFHNWTYKLFPVLYGFAGFFFSYKLGSSLYGRKTGLLAAWILFGSEAFFLLAMDVHTDLLLQTNVTLAIWQLAEYTLHRRQRNFLLAFVAIGLALMSKGPIGGAIPAFALGVHLLAKRDFRQLFHPQWLLGIAIALIITTPAFLGLYNQFGVKGLKFFFFTNNIGRITGEYAGKNSDPFFYMHTLLYLFAPWAFFLVWALWREFIELFRSPKNRTEFFTTGGIWIFFFIASVAKGKAPHYIFALIPLFAIVTAKWLQLAISEAENRTMKLLGRLNLATTFVLTAFLMLTVFYLFPARNFTAAIVPALFAGTALCLQARPNHTDAFFFTLPLVMLMGAMAFYLNFEALPQAFAYQASTRASEIYNREAKDSERLYNYRYGQYEVFFYSKGHAYRLYSANDLKPEKKKIWIFTDEIGKDSILAKSELKIIHIDTLMNRGMNRAGIQFLNPATREQSLSPMYLIQTKSRQE